MAIPSLIDANAFHSDRANTVWSNLDDGAKTASLYRASDYVLNTYKFKSTIADPSADANVQEAIIMLAGTMAVATSSVNSELSDQNLKQDALVKRTKSQLDNVGLKEVEYQATTEVLDPYPLVTARLRSVVAGKAALVVVKAEK